MIDTSVMSLKQALYLKMLQKSKSWQAEHNFPGGKIDYGKPVYIIRRSGRSLGLFSYVSTNLARIKYALDNDMIPVIDMRHFDNSLKCSTDDNPWEAYFKQPGGLSLKDAYKSKKIILSASNVPDEYPDDSMRFFNNEEGVLNKWREIADKNIHIEDDVLEYVDSRYKELFPQKDKVLGVLARGTDYASLKPSKHPIQPNGDEILNKAKTVMNEYGYERIFLATEDRNIAEKFACEFQDKLITNDKKYIDYQGGYLAEQKSELDKFAKNRDYLTNMILLGRCNAIVAGRTSGTVGAALLSQGWEEQYFFDLGIYD